MGNLVSQMPEKLIKDLITNCRDLMLAKVFPDSSAKPEDSTKQHFIEPLFSRLGWSQDITSPLKFVREYGVAERGSKWTDYALVIENTPRMFVEVKPLFEKNLEKHIDQLLNDIERYNKDNTSGSTVFWGLLTNFQRFLFFYHNDGQAFLEINFEELSDEIDTLRKVLSPEGLKSDLPSSLYRETTRKALDELFLNDMKKWRLIIANGIFKSKKIRDTDELRGLSQTLLSRIIFTRILENKGVLPYEWMRKRCIQWKEGIIGLNQSLGTVLDSAFKEIYSIYDTDLFEEEMDFLEDFPDDLLLEILKVMGNPQLNCVSIIKLISIEITSKDLGIYGYNLNLLTLDILGSVYERFLAHKLEIIKKGGIEYVSIKDWDQLQKEEGSYFTPVSFAQYLVEKSITSHVDTIFEKAMVQLEDGHFEESIREIRNLSSFKILDPSCGSGTFLVLAYRKIIRVYKEFSNHFNKKLTQVFYSKGKLPDFQVLRVELGEIALLENIFGVDKDPQAVEFAKLNLWSNLLVEEIDRYLPVIRERRKYLLPSLKLNIQVFNSILKGDFSQIEDRTTLLNNSTKLARRFRHAMVASAPKEDSKQVIERARISADNLFDEYKNSIEEAWGLATHDAIFSKYSFELPIVWQLAFPEVFSREKSGFDVILTNPPFIAYHSRQTQEISPDLLEFYLSSYGDLGGKRPNTYLFFMELWFKDLLCDDGIIGFVIDQALRDLPSYSHVRKYLLENTNIRAIVPSINFPTSEVDVSLIVCKKGTKSGNIEWVEDPFDPNCQPKIIPASKFHETPNLTFIISEQIDFLEKIESANTIPLSEVCDVACGLEYSSLLPVYFLSSEKEDETFHPALDGADDIPERYMNDWHPDKGEKAFVRFDKSFEESLIAEGKNISKTGKTVLFASGDESRYKKSKIILRQTCPQFIGILDEGTSKYGHFYSLRNTHVINLKNEEWSIQYILGILNSRVISVYGVERNIIRTTGESRQPQIRIGDLKRLPIAIPPEETRNEIFEFFSEKTKRISDLKRFHSLIHTYFRGNLSENSIIKFKKSIQLERILNPKLDYKSLFSLSLIKSRIIDSATLGIPRHYWLEWKNSNQFDVLCRTTESDRIRLASLCFDNNESAKLKDFLWLMLNENTGRASYKKPVSLHKTLVDRFKIFIPRTPNIIDCYEPINQFIEELWNSVIKEIVILDRPDNLFQLLNECENLEEQLENKVGDLYGVP